MKELSFYEFTQLSESERYDLVFREGEFIDSSIRNDVKFALYKLYSFNVEVIYDSTGNRIIGLTSFLKSE
ncbi:hypothetical protein C1634_023095 [Chryseobacterium viscerum]|uniref:Uncharacterized protein n=1 Tax=Chryseobacterium viscerum TaxID=1037377 RepID=A0A316WAX6_9FLAO|nr:hypothetical protein C1634_023095 [Chryseobacterium viscerum]